MVSLLVLTLPVLIGHYILVEGTLKVSLVNEFTTRANTIDSKYFTCYISESDSSDVTVESRRVSNTQTDRFSNNRPPSNPTIVDGGYRIYLSNAVNGAFGVFACDVSRANGDSTSVQTILLQSTANIVPSNRLLTRTVNAGDPQIVLEMEEITENRNEPLWRKDGGIAFDSRTFSLNVPETEGPITTSDAGVYECHHNKNRDSAVHGLQRLIVRECPADHWGPPDCFGICDNCYNGGICDDTNGECICPAGFRGPNCLSACGSSGNFGVNCEYQCRQGRNNNPLYCRGSMVCLPDPFGCRCTSGFTGLSCNTICTSPTFGANCLERCHCANGVGCNIYTGVCNNNSPCETGYTGENCQIPPICKQGYYGTECILKCHCKNDAACDRNTGRCDQGCAKGFQVRLGAENCQACNLGYYGNDCEEECHCSGGCQNVNGTCTRNCKTPWVYFADEPCQTGIANITVAKVNPGGTAEVSCTVQSQNYIGSVTAALSKSKPFQISSDIESVGQASLISATRKIQQFRVSNVFEGDVFYCFLSYTERVVDSTRYYQDKAAEIFVLPELSDPPQLISVSSTSVSISWRAWTEDHDRGDPPVVAYVPYHQINSVDVWTRGSIHYSSSLEVSFDSLESDTLYHISVAAIRMGAFGEGPRSPLLPVKTKCSQPKASPFNVQARLVEGERNNVNITWEVPDENVLHCSTGVTGFIILVNDLENMKMLHTEVMSGANHLWHIHMGLEDGKNYSFQVKLLTEGGEGPLSEPSDEARVFVPVAMAEADDDEDEEEREGTGEAQQGAGSSLLWLPIVLIVVILLAVIMAIVVIKRRRNYLGDKVPQHASYPDMPQSETAVQESGLNGKTSDTPSSNGEDTIPLKATAASKPGPDIPEWTADPNEEDEFEMDYLKDGDNIYGNLERPTAVKVEDFPKYVATKTQSKTDNLIHEFMILAKDANYPCSVGAKEENKKKNRFRNMLPYDNSRVVLDLLPDDPHSDYFNASYMLDQNDAVSFIASQGPNKASTCDFWRMLWKEDVSIIVMVTNLYENGKERCAQYWPEKEGKEKKWGQITVTWTGTENYANHLVREMTMSKDDEQRTVSQYHFTTWPDMGVPTEPTSLIMLVQQVKGQNKGKNSPVLVHCSAGIGRTGTFIALYSLMDVLKSRKYINVYEFVEKMRRNRINMVQTPVQYQFLCDALAEVYQTSHIEIPSGLLQNLDLRSKKTTLQEEFQLLNKLSTNTDMKCSVGQDPENASKNRFPDIYPPDENRPFVSGDRNFRENDYINATFVNTYTKKDAFITTQAPLPNTIEAFWRMICDWRVPLIVMLNQLTKADKTCPCYWPRRGTQSYSSVTVTLTAEENKGPFIHRQFEISITSAQRTCSVDHFQLLAWPGEGQAATGLTQLLEASKLILNHYTKEPAVIHCIDGVGRSGVLVTVQSEIERMRREDKVNIFQSARQLRNSNPLFMADQEHYLTCYRLLQSWLNAAPEYGNI